MPKARYAHNIAVDEETEKKLQEVLKDYTFIRIVKAGIEALKK